jgi:anti-anti-sigma regulatory factor
MGVAILKMIRIDCIKLSSEHALISVQGSLRSEGVQELTDLLSALKNQGITIFEVDLAKVSFVSGTGLRLLKLIRRNQLMQGAVIKLVSVSSFIESLLEEAA